MPDVTSSVIARIRHEAATRVLTVTFLSGRTYAYDGVSRRLYDDFLAAPSHGAFFNDHVRDRYPTREITARRGCAPR